MDAKLIKWLIIVLFSISALTGCYIHHDRDYYRDRDDRHYHDRDDSHRYDRDDMHHRY
jgi:hypothetical protein